MRLDLRGLISVLAAAALAFAINVFSVGRYSLSVALALVLGAAVVLQVTLEFIFQLVVPFLRPTMEGRWLETAGSPTGARYALCTIDLDPGGIRGRFHGRSYDESGNRTGEFESPTLLLDSASSFLYEFSGTLYQQDGKSTTVQGMGRIQFDVKNRGRWIKGHGHFFHVMQTDNRFIIELERLTPQLRRTLIGKTDSSEPFEERNLVRAYHARRVQGMTSYKSETMSLEQPVEELGQSTSGAKNI